MPPLLEYTPAVAPAGAMFYTGDIFPCGKMISFFATLVGCKLVRVKFKDQEPIEQEFLLKDQLGRLRDLAQGIEVSIHVITSDTDAYGPGRKEGDRLLYLVPFQ